MLRGKNYIHRQSEILSSSHRAMTKNTGEICVNPGRPCMPRKGKRCPKSAAEVEMTCIIILDTWFERMKGKVSIATLITIKINSLNF